jgi:hypothetical protein
LLHGHPVVAELPAERRKLLYSDQIAFVGAPQALSESSKHEYLIGIDLDGSLVRVEQSRLFLGLALHWHFQLDIAPPHISVRLAATYYLPPLAALQFLDHFYH